MNTWSQIRAVAFLFLPLCLLATKVQADPIQLSTTAAGSLDDRNGDGVAEGGSFYGVVSLTPGIYENRAWAEYNAAPLDAGSVLSARLSGPLESNGNWNRGSTIQVLAYAGNGMFDLDDFSRPAIPAGTFPMPASLWDYSFDIDVTDAVRQLLAQNASWIGFRFESLTPFENVRIGEHAGVFGVFLTAEQAPAVPEPGTLLLLGTGMGTLLTRRLRRSSRQPS
jgi:hypothetical protein